MRVELIGFASVGVASVFLMNLKDVWVRSFCSLKRISKIYAIIFFANLVKICSGPLRRTNSSFLRILYECPSLSKLATTSCTFSLLTCLSVFFGKYFTHVLHTSYLSKWRYPFSTSIYSPHSPHMTLESATYVDGNPNWVLKMLPLPSVAQILQRWK